MSVDVRVDICKNLKKSEKKRVKNWYGGKKKRIALTLVRSLTVHVFIPPPRGHWRWRSRLQARETPQSSSELSCSTSSETIVNLSLRWCFPLQTTTNSDLSNFSDSEDQMFREFNDPRLPYTYIYIMFIHCIYHDTSGHFSLPFECRTPLFLVK